MSQRLDGKRAVITGAASGIGRAIAHAFADAGAEIVFLDLNAAQVQSAAAEIGSATQARCNARACDVSSETAVADVFGDLREGGIDILVNSAGIAHIGTVLTTSPEEFDRLFQVNVRGTYLCMQAGIRAMAARGRGGVVLNMASIAATSGLNERFAYSMTKGAVLSMTLSAAKDCLPLRIRCNCISPARVHTPFVDGFLHKTYPGREEEMMEIGRRPTSWPYGHTGGDRQAGTVSVFR